MHVLSHISKCYQQHLVIDDLSLSLADENITCLLGPSGCGKSTLLRILAGLIQADAGTVKVKTNQCAIVFQEPRLLPWLTVNENLSLSLPFWLNQKQKRRIIQQTLEQVQLTNIGQLMPNELSGGMAQRVGIARALIKNPDILLMDEPFAALDAITRKELQLALQHVITTRKTTCLFVTHDINEALTIGHKILVMRQGKITYQYQQNPNIDPERIKQQIITQLQIQ